MILKDIVLSPAVPFAEIVPFTTDFVTFMNGYFQKIKNFLREVVYLKHLPAINMRRKKDCDQYCMIESDGSKTDFKVGPQNNLSGQCSIDDGISLAADTISLDNS
jgi:hypothetical protein